MSIDKISRGSRIWEAHSTSPKVTAVGSPLNTGRSTTVASTPRDGEYSIHPRYWDPSPAAGMRTPSRPIVASPAKPMRSSRSAYSRSRPPATKEDDDEEPQSTPRCSPRRLDMSLDSSMKSAGYSPRFSARNIGRMRSEPGLMSSRSQGTIGCFSCASRPGDYSPRQILFGADRFNMMNGSPSSAYFAAEGSMFDTATIRSARKKDFSPRSCMDGVDWQGKQKSSLRTPRVSQRAVNKSLFSSDDFTMTATATLPPRGTSPENEAWNKEESGPASPRRMRQQVGRITQNSEAWFGTEHDNVVPGQIANAEDYVLSRGIKTDYTELDSVRGRLRLDASQPNFDIPASQRRHGFDGIEATPSMKAGNSVAFCSDTQSNNGNTTPTIVVVKSSMSNAPSCLSPRSVYRPGHATSREMAAAITGDMSCKSVNFLVGNELVDGDKWGRRTVADCARAAVERGTLGDGIAGMSSFPEKPQQQQQPSGRQPIQPLLSSVHSTPALGLNSAASSPTAKSAKSAKSMATTPMSTTTRAMLAPHPGTMVTQRVVPMPPTPRDQRASLAIQENFKSQAAGGDTKSVPVVYASSPVVLPTALQSTSILPANTSRDCSSLFGSMQVVRHQPRGIGKFSPSARHRTLPPATPQVLSL